MQLTNQLLSYSLARLNFNMQVYYNRNQEYQGFKYDEMGFIVRSKDDDNDSISKFMKKLMDKIRIFYHQKDTKVYAYMGKKNIQLLMDFVNRDGLGNQSFEQSLFYQKFKESHTHRFDLFYQFSLSNLFGNFLSKDQNIEDQDSPGSVGGLVLKNSSLETYNILSAQELTSFVHVFNFFSAFTAPILENTF